MQKKHAIKLLSYRRVRQVLADNQTAVASAKVMTDSNNEFDSRMNHIEGIAVPSSDATRPSTAYKNEVMEEFADALVPVMDGVLLFANDTNNMVLAGKIPTTPTALRTGNEVTRLQRFHTVLDACKSVARADLENYGVEEIQITNLTTQLEVLDALVGTPRMAIDARLLLRTELDAAFAGMDDFLTETLDRAVRNRQPKFPNFVAAYFQARKLHEMPSQPLEAELEEVEAIAPKSVEAAPVGALDNALTAVGNGVLELNGAH